MKVKLLQRGGDMMNNDILEAATRFYARQLMSERMANSLHIRLSLRVGGRDAKSLAEVELFAVPRQKLFSINVARDGSIEKKLMSLAHEMAHVAQITSKRLRLIQRKGGVNWHWGTLNYGLLKDNEYWTSPWEVDAREQQGILFGKWLDRMWG